MSPLFRSAPKVHRVAVYDTRPLPDDQKPFKPYFIALCECGWFGEARSSSEQAFDDAYGHDSNVDAEPKRPVG
jgi:hypothetical protein